MNKINKRKYGVVFMIAVGIGAMTVSYQNFTSGPSLSETTQREPSSLSNALTAAMQTAEQDHLQKQMAMNVEPSQVEASLKKERKISTVEVPSTIGNDTIETARPVKPSPHSDDDFDLEDAN